MNTKTFKISEIKGVIIVLSALAVLGIGSTVYAQADKNILNTTQELKEVQGEVTWIGQGKIAVVYNRDEKAEYEMLLPYDNSVSIKNKRKMSDIKAGDTVKIEYEEKVIEYKDRKEGKLKATAVTFIKPAAAPLTSSELTPLELKGVKGE